MKEQPKPGNGGSSANQRTFGTKVFAIGAAMSLLKSIWQATMVIVRGQ